MPKYQSLAVRNQMQTRVKEIESAQANPIAWGVIKDKNKILEEKKRLEKTLSEITPPDLDGPGKDKLRARLNQLLPAYKNGISGVVCAKPTEAQMWNGRAHDVGAHMEHENFWLHHTLAADGKTVIEQRGRGAEDEIKDIQRTLNKEKEPTGDPSIGSTEVFRDMSSTVPLTDAVKRSYGLSERARQNYDQVFPDHEPTLVEEKIESAEVERLSRELADLRAQIASLSPAPKLASRSAKREAQSRRMKERWAARKAAQTEAEPSA